MYLPKKNNIKNLSSFQERNFRSLGISHFFDVVIVSKAVGLRKPDKEIFELACQKLAVKSEKEIFVGDNPQADVGGANKVGMYSVYIPGNYGTTCKEADAVCPNFMDLPSIVTNAR